MAEENSAAVGLLTAKDLFSRYAASVVAVVTTDSLGDQHIGSAFHVGEGVFVTARHVVEGMINCQVEVDSHRALRLPGAPVSVFEMQPISVRPAFHSDPAKDVAVFSVSSLSWLPTIPLGDHLDDWIGDDDFILTEVLVLGYPPIPLSQRNVLVATRAQVNAVVDLINVPHVHFIVSATARGGFSGGVVLSEWGTALGVVTSSLVKNGAVEELGYLTVLTIEPILECLAACGLLTRELAVTWDGLFTAKTQYYGEPEIGRAHSWVKVDRDGHRARVIFATPDAVVVEKAQNAVRALPNVQACHCVKPVEVHVWEVQGEYACSEEPAEEIRRALDSVLASEGYGQFDKVPRQVVRSLRES